MTLQNYTTEELKAELKRRCDSDKDEKPQDVTECIKTFEDFLNYIPNINDDDLTPYFKIPEHVFLPDREYERKAYVKSIYDHKKLL